jgi:hypothetical protein
VARVTWLGRWATARSGLTNRANHHQNHGTYEVTMKDHERSLQ